MKKILALSVILFGLAGCSSDSQVVLVDETPLEQLNGTWLKACEVDGTTSSSTTLVMSNGNATSNSITYSDTTCTTLSMIEPTENFTYILGSVAAVDGTVAGITLVNEFDATDATGTAFTVYVIDSLVNLYFGDIDADPAKDGSTVDKRPTVLDSMPFVFVKK